MMFFRVQFIWRLTEKYLKNCFILDKLIESFREKEDKYKDVVKLGRTHLQDATPLSVGAEISAWKYSLEMVKDEIVLSTDYLTRRNLAIGEQP